jgi:hypothetical protein
MDIHRDKIKWELMNAILKIKEFKKKSQEIISCQFCDPDKPNEIFNGTKSKVKQHHRVKHGKR